MSGVVQALLAAYGAAKDAYFKYVTLLLPGNGTNGAQNNTFLDSSTNNFTITRNGNTTQGTFTPYGANWSNYFDGTGDYLSLTGTALGSGDFTVECWFNMPSWSTSNYSVIGSASSGTTAGWELYLNGPGSNIRLWSNAGDVISSSTTIQKGVWYHLALVRSGSTATLYINGVSTGSATFTSNLTNTTMYVSYDQYAQTMTGYVSNVRHVVGTAVYTSAFTPPTAPLTAITNTSLLTCQSNRFIDNSTNNFTITVNGDTSVQRFSPFNPTTPYAAGTIGGSGYFDGSGDNITAPSNAAYTFGTGDFTVEMWVYPQSDAIMALIDARSTGTAVPWAIYTNATTRTPYWYDGTIRNSSIALTLNAWNHVAVARSSGTLKIFVNGAEGYSAANSTDINSTGTVQIGGAFSALYYTGYISNLRVIKGTAVYTAAFTPPTAPVTAITNTSLLLNFTNGGIIDNAMMNDLETVGNAQISTSVSKFGGGSIAFDGTGDYLTTYGTPQFAFGAGDFTIECWVYFNSLTQYDCIIDFRPSGTNGAYPCIFVDTSNTLVYYVSSANRITSSAVSTGQWYHLAVSRTGTSTKMFLNGVQTGSTYTDSNSYLVGNPLTIGGLGYNSPGTYALDGYIDDLRITKGYARYTADFTPPTQAFPLK